MSQNVVLTGANVKVFINNKLYKECQSISLNISYAEQEIFGIDSVYAQEIAVTKVTVSGSVQGLRIKNSGGLQAGSLRPLFSDVIAGPYISIRIEERSTGEDIVFIPQAKVSDESHSVSVKGTYKLNFNFKGLIPLQPLDRS